MQAFITKILIVAYMILMIASVYETESNPDIKHVYCEFDKIQYTYYKCK